MNGTYFVYKHTFPNGMVYVGLSRQTPEMRWRKDGKAYIDFDFYDDILKYGWETIKHEILYDGLTKSEASQKEKELIAYYKKLGVCYNKDKGGSCGPYTSVDIEYGDSIYNSKEIASMSIDGINSHDVTTRISRGWDIEKVMTKPKIKKNKIYEYNGKQYTPEELYEVRINKDLSLSDIRNRLKKCWDVERAITQLKGVKVQPFGTSEKKYLYQGKYLTSHDLFLLRKDERISRHDITSRISRGWTIEDAISKPPKTFNEKFEYKGSLYTIRELLKFSTVRNLSYDVLYKRIKKYGWDIERALTTDVK